MIVYFIFFFFNDTATTEIYTLSLHDALPIYRIERVCTFDRERTFRVLDFTRGEAAAAWGGSDEIERLDLRSEEHTSELQSRQYLVCRLLLEKKKKKNNSSLT